MKKVTKVQKRAIPAELPGGFRDYSPAEAMARQRIVGTVRRTFESFGFELLETPAVERTETLAGGEEESAKIIFNVVPSKGLEKKNRQKISLRFDLTVPLARFIASNPEIPKPFKRYQIGNVWRGESPQKGRYREFLQADADIVGASSTDADTEIAIIIYQTLANLGLQKFVIKINNRKILSGLPSFAGFPEKKLPELLRIIDKREKIGDATVKKELIKVFKKKTSEKIEEFITIGGTAKEKLLQARELFKGTAPVEEGVKELADIIRGLRAYGVPENNWEIDFSLVRGLGYYTGPVFEAVLTDAKDIGSIFGGGRYDDLTAAFGQKIPAVGVSAGVDRLFAALESLNLLKPRATTTRVLIFNLSLEMRNDYFALAARLRKSNINTSLYLGEDRAFQAQLAYALKKEIPLVVIYGPEEQKKKTVLVKNLVTRTQEAVSPENLSQYLMKC